MSAKRKLSPKAEKNAAKFKGKKQAVNKLKSEIKKAKQQARKFQSSIDDLERQLATVGDDAQLANIDMQNMLQKQQQTLQMMSNVSKVMHDTAMAVIRKIGS